MSIFISNEMSTTDVVRLALQGEKLQCPVCGTVLKIIPEKWDVNSNIPFHGIECSKDMRHYTIVCDNETVMRQVRDRIKKITQI